ncbi:MAG TPA: hypothetical protein VLA34_04570, partial [Candidatus Krumholzibacterium sp.]|nr:hypothetical protein [Candidatus Krumholzibacterium sp.]
MENRIPPIDEQSSVHGRMTTIIVFTVLVALAVASMVLEPDYMAHVPVTVGVSSLDPVRADATLKAFGDFIREKGGGDIEWVYLPPGETPAGCDFYLATPLQIRGPVEAGQMEIALLASVEGERTGSSGLILTRSGPSGDGVPCSCIFTHPWSASGYLSASVALAGKGLLCDGEDPETLFGSCLQCEEEMLYGVLFGEFKACGISADRFERFVSSNPALAGLFEVTHKGPPVTDLVMAVDRRVEQWKRQGFLTRLPVITAATAGL